jgi:ElaB/YqjD/DUF883 family membrane-anchored ribosome-binding protein
MLGFLVGAIGGGVATYYWRDSIRTYLSGRVPDLRAQAADALGKLGSRADRGLDAARSRIDAAVRTGQRRLRPVGSGTTEGARGTEEHDAGQGTAIRS